MEADRDPVIEPGHGPGSDVTGMDWSNASENASLSSCADHPSLDCMERWLIRAEYSNFRRLVETGAGKDYLHEMAGKLFSFFVSEPVLHERLKYESESLLSNGLRFLLEEMHLQVDVRSAHLKRTTLLLSLVDELNVDLVEVCLRCGADPNMTRITMETDAAHAQDMHDCLGSTTAHEPDAQMEDTSPALHVLIKSSLDCLVHQKFRYCKHRLICGTEQRRLRADHGRRVLEVAKLLCQHGSDVCARNEQGLTPVMLLLRCCSKWLSQSEIHNLLTCGECSLKELQAYPTSVDECASKLMDLLIQHGAELPEVLPEKASLQSLLMKGFPALVREIVSCGADVCGVDRSGRTLLHCAIVYADAKTVEFFLEAALSAAVCGRGGTLAARLGRCTFDCTLRGDEGQVMDRSPGEDLDSCTNSMEPSSHQRGQYFEESLVIGQSPPLELCDDLICAGIQRGDVNILHVLCSRLTCTRPTLLTAAFALDTEVVGCLLEYQEWPDADFVDLLKLQAAVRVAIHHLNWLSLSECNSPTCADPQSRDFHLLTVDTYGDMCGPIRMSAAKIKQLLGGRVSLLLSAEELLDKAVQVGRSVEIPELRAELEVWGHVVREAITIDELKQLRQLTGNPNHPGRHISGTHFHSLLVLQRLAPDSHLYVRYALSLITSLWSEVGSLWDVQARDQMQPENIPVYNLLCCNEVLLQLCSTTVLLGGVQLEGMLKEFGKTAVCLMRLGEAFMARQLNLNVVPWLKWLGHMVGECSVSMIPSAYLAVHLLSILARAKPGRKQLRCAAEAISTARKSHAHGRLFSQVLMLQIVRQFPPLHLFELPALTEAFHALGAVARPRLLLKPLVDQSDGVEHMVETLLNTGFPLPDLHVSHQTLTYFLVLAIGKYGRLFRAMIRHGLEFLSHRPQDMPLLAAAVRQGNIETVECLLDFGAGQDWLDFLESRALEQELSEANATDVAPEFSSRWRSPGPADDLPDIAARGGRYAILKALHRAGIRATAPATVFEAALHTNPETLEFLLETGQWTGSVVCDALRLQSACCLMESVSQSLLPRLSHDTLLISPTHHCTTCQNGLYSQLSSSSTCPCLSTAFRMLEHAADIADKVNLSNSLGDSNQCIFLQQSVQLSVCEAGTVYELQELGRIEFPSMIGCTLRGWHFHALLVFLRLSHPSAVRILRNMLLILVGGKKTFCPKNDVRQDQETALYTLSADGRIASMSLGFARSLFACLDMGAYWATQLLAHPMGSWTANLDAGELGDVMRMLRGLAFWLLSNDVAFNIPTVINMFMRFAVYLAATERMTGLRFMPRHFLAKLYLMCVAHMRAGTRGHSQLAEIASLLVYASTTIGCDGILNWMCDLLAQGYCTERYKNTDTNLPASGCKLPWDSDKVASEAVAMLFQAGLTVPNVSRGLLHQLLAKQFSRLLGVLAHHGVDFWASDEICDIPLIVQACKVSSPTMIRCLLEGWRNAVSEGLSLPRGFPPGNGMAVNGKVGTASLGTAVQESRERDLWSIALQRTKDRISVLDVLTRCGFAATTAALFQPALSLSSEAVSDLLNTSAFTSAEAADTLALHFAFCLWKAGEEPRKKCSVQFMEDTVTYLSSREVSVDGLNNESTAPSGFGLQQMDSKSGHGRSARSAQCRSPAVAILKKAVEACTALPVRPASSSLDIAGYEVREGWTWDDFVQLARVSIATDGKQPLSGLLLHGLLVFDRVLPQHPVTFEFFRFVTQLPRCKSKPAQNTLHLQKLERYAIVTHHVRMWQKWSADDVTKLMGQWKPLEFICEALGLAKRLYSEGTIVDTLPLFSWLHCLLANKMPLADFDFSTSVQVLLELAHPSHTSAMAAQQLERVSEILVATCTAGVTTIKGGSVLHELVSCVTCEGWQSAHVRMRQRPSSVRALRALLAAPGGCVLVNRVDNWNDTAAHQLLDSCGRKFSRTRDDFLSQLLELLDASGQHWDCFYGQPYSLLEILRACSGQFRLLKTALGRRVPSLQCLAATAAAQHHGPQTCQQYLPRLMADVVAQHRPTPDNDFD